MFDCSNQRLTRTCSTCALRHVSTSAERGRQAPNQRSGTYYMASNENKCHNRIDYVSALQSLLLMHKTTTTTAKFIYLHRVIRIIEQGRV